MLNADFQGLAVRKGDTLTSAWTTPTAARTPDRTYPIEPPFVVPAAGFVYLALNDDGKTARVEKFVPLELTEGTE